MSIEQVFVRKRGADDIAWGVGSLTYKNPITGVVSTIAKVNAGDIPFATLPNNTIDDLVDGGNDVSIGVDDLAVADDATVGGDLTVTGGIVGATLSISGVSAVAGNFGVNGLLLANGGARFTTLANGVAHLTGANGTLASSTIVNADVDAAAAIAVTKIAGITSLPTDVAIQSEQETGTITTKYVSPGFQQFHQSACKCWVRINGTAVPADYAGTPYNVTSITDNGVGDYTITIGTDFSSANYAAAAMGEQQAATEPVVVTKENTQATGTFGVTVWDRATDVTMDTDTYVIMFGDLI